MQGRRVKHLVTENAPEIKVDVGGLAANMHILEILNAADGGSIGRIPFIKE